MKLFPDSIFYTVLRSASKVFFSILALFLAVGIGGKCIYSLFSSSSMRKEKTTLATLPDLNGREDLLPPHTPVVLKLKIHGIIGIPKQLDSQVIENILLDSRRGLLQNNRVKAILLDLNTPGGGVFDSASIYQMLKEYKERYNVPIYAYINGLCASGGMYIASAADRSYASYSSVVGSIGVLSRTFLNVSDALSKIGIQAKTLIQGLEKDAMNPFRPWKPNEEDSIQPIMNYFYRTFVDVITSTHPRLDRQKLITEYGAKVFDAPTGAEYGFIDIADAEYKTALHDLLLAANIDPDQPYQIVELNPKFDLFEKLMEGPLSGKVEHSISLGGHQLQAIRDPFAYLYDPTSL